MSRRSMWPGILVSLLVPAVIFAGNAVLPFTFTSGSPIRASEMNANFEALRAAINLGNSGTRLKSPKWRSADGAQVPLTGFQTGWWDAQLKFECTPFFSVNGGRYGGRCLPNLTLEHFTDPNCVQGATRTYGMVFEILNFTQDAGLSNNFARADDGGVYRLGPVQSGQLYSRSYLGLPDGGVSVSCDPANFGGSSPSFHSATVPVPITDFAEIQWVVE